MRPLRSIAAILGLAVSASSLAGPTLIPESLRHAPLSRSALQALRGPGVTVEERQGRTTSGDDAHCHDVACMVFSAPFILAQRATAEAYDEVEVRDAHGLRALGRFRRNGALSFLIERTRGDAYRRIDALELRALGSTAVLVTAEAQSDQGQWQPVAEEPQLGLTRTYAAAIDARPKDEGRLLVEALEALEQEAMPLARARLARSSAGHRAASDAAAAEVARAMCTATIPAQTRTDVLVLTSADPGPLTARALVECQAPVSAAVDRTDAVRQLAVSACTHPPDEQLLQLLSAQARDGNRRALTQAMRACSASPSATWLQACLGFAPSRADWSALFKAGSRYVDAVVPCLDQDEPRLRDGWLEAMRAQPTVFRWPAHFERSTTAPTSEELEALAAHYVRPDLGYGRYVWRAHALRVFARARGSKIELRAARQRIEAALRATTPDTERPADHGVALAGEHVRNLLNAEQSDRASFHAALVVLGERDHGLAAARAILPGEQVHGDPQLATTQSAMAAFALALSGCSLEELTQAARRARAEPRELTGPACAGH